MQLPGTTPRRLLTAVACASVLAVTTTAAGPDQKKPSVSVKASPMVGFSPARMVLTAEVKGGPNDYEEFYCPTIEWDWGDDTKSEAKADCDPYEAGKSEIKRRYTIDHVFNTSGDYRVEFRLKQKSKIVGKASAEVKIRPGIRDGGDWK